MSKSIASTFAFYGGQMGAQPPGFMLEFLVAGCGSSFQQSLVKLQEVRL
jgi:hypothetical protein